MLSKNLQVYECLLACMQVYQVRAVPMEGKRDHWTSWNWSYNWLLAIICVCWGVGEAVAMPTGVLRESGSCKRSKFS